VILWCLHLLRAVEVPISNLVPVNRLSRHMFVYLFSRVQQIVACDIKYRLPQSLSHASQLIFQSHIIFRCQVTYKVVDLSINAIATR
jgi:hypothetical protein